MRNSTQAGRDRTQFVLQCGCVMDIGRGGYVNVCVEHKAMPSFEDFKRALHTLPPTSESLHVINQFNERRSQEIREAHGVRAVETWAELPLVGNVILTTIGAKTGKERIVPLGAIRRDSNLLLKASVCGSPTHPAWYYNVTANPNVLVETCGYRYPATARVADGEERTELWRYYAAFRPIQDEFQSMVDREIPVVVLTQTGAPLHRSPAGSDSPSE